MNELTRLREAMKQLQIVSERNGNPDEIEELVREIQALIKQWKSD